MSILDTKERFANLDPQNMRASIDFLPEQCISAWGIFQPLQTQKFDICIIAGMGGSCLAARVIQSLYGNKMTVPLICLQDYVLPRFAGTNTLVICSSHSGNTEETISVMEQAIKRKCKIYCIASGGKIEEIAKANGIVCLTIPSMYNPSGQPRMAIGYSLAIHLALFKGFGLIDLNEKDFLDGVSLMRVMQKDYGWDTPSSKNIAKIFAQSVYEKGILLCSAEHLVGSTHVFNNMINENAKALSYPVVLPEANHHLLEGLIHPYANMPLLHAFFVQSQLYSQSLQKRMKITQEVLEKNNVRTTAYTIPGSTPLVQSLVLIQFAAYANFYLAMLYGQNPSPIPWVDYFKQRLQVSTAE